MNPRDILLATHVPINSVVDDSPIKAVFAGHLHFKYTVPLNENITEYVLDKSFSGNVGVIRVE